MGILNSDQIRVAVEVMRHYLSDPAIGGGRTAKQIQSAQDARRVELIEHDLKPLLRSYLSGRTPLSEFKTRNDGINKRNELWGFKGAKGQMFFNMVVNAAEDDAEVDSELKAAVATPPDEDGAASRIRTFASYVKRLATAVEERDGSRSRCPKVSSVPFFLSYFWQIEQRDVWPVYYTSSVNALSDLNLWQPTDNPAADYVSFKQVHEELARAFTEHSGQTFGLYDVEHVFWFREGNPRAKAGSPPPAQQVVAPVALAAPVLGREPPSTMGLPDSYLPPIVSALDRMACNDEEMRAAAASSATSLERAFEKSVNAAFTILGYDAKLLGQGQGRVPDGQALALDDAYAILWDAKVRTNGYAIGTDDRTIKEYITTFSRDLKRKRGLRNIYYLIISGEFSGDFDDTVRMIKMETDVSEVCLVEAAALIAMVDARLRAPLQISLGPDGLQQLLAVSGIITPEIVRENLTGL